MSTLKVFFCLFIGLLVMFSCTGDDDDDSGDDDVSDDDTGDDDTNEESECLIEGEVYQAGQPNPQNPCQSCDPESSENSWTDVDGITCDDDVYCNGADLCLAGACDVHEGNPCDDDLYCNGEETCEEENRTCSPGTEPCQDDDRFCTGTIVCNEEENRCLAENVPCGDDGVYCNGEELCDEIHDECKHRGNPCSDGVFCNGEEVCDEADHSCAPGVDPCDDGLFCNGEENCWEYNESCHSPGRNCDDGLFCTGEEVCDEEEDQCVSLGLECDDGVYCNGTETCSEALESCVSSGNPCLDETFCNGSEVCDEETHECTSPGDPCPDDGIWCNGAESCDEQYKRCAHEGSPCGDGLFCNGKEFCNELGDECISAGNPCDFGGCNEDTNECNPEADVEWVAGSHPGGTPISMAVDAGGEVYMLHRRASQLILHALSAEDTGEEIVGWNVFHYDLAADEQGALHIAYKNNRNNTLVYKTNAGGVWNETVVDIAGDSDGAVSIAAQPDGHVHIAYCDGGYNNLKYATNTSGEWYKFLLESEGSIGVLNDIALDEDNFAHIVYSCSEGSEDKLKYATNRPRGWATQTFAEISYFGIGSNVSIAVESGGEAHITFYDPLSGGFGNLFYATNEEGIWQVMPMSDAFNEDIGISNQIAVDDEGQLHIVNTLQDEYESAITQKTNYLKGRPGNWTTYSSFGSSTYYWRNWVTVAQYVGLALDASGVPHIGYATFNPGYELNYAAGPSGEWIFTLVDATDGNAFSTGSAVLDENGDAHISYRTSRRLYTDQSYATDKYGEWEQQTVQEGYYYYGGPTTGHYELGLHGQYSSIYLNDAGTAYIAYKYYYYRVPYGLGPEDYYHSLFRANNEEEDHWSFGCMDLVGCSHISVATSPDDTSYIAYYQSPRTSLHSGPVGEYFPGLIIDARPGGWEVVDEEARGFSDLAVDSGGYIHAIFYMDGPGYELCYTNNTSGSWQRQVVDVGYEPDSTIALAVDGNDNACISYYDQFDENLKYATGGGGSWNIETVAEEGDVGYHPSLAIDESDSAHIAYFDVSNKQLRYSTNASGVWSHVPLAHAAEATWRTITLLDEDAVRIFYVNEGGLFQASVPLE